MPKRDVTAMPFASFYPAYVNKVEKKGRTKDELDEVLCWLTGYSADELHGHIDAKVETRRLIEEAPLNPDRELVTGVVCGVRVEEVDEPILRELRRMDKLVDELAKGKAMEKILRSPAEAS